MSLGRILKHLFYPPWLLKRALPVRTVRRVESAVADSEARHTGEIRFAVEASLELLPLLRGQTARERAVEVFSDLRVWDTEQNNGVLVYLLLADRDVEIVADRGLNGRVTPEAWEAICLEMEAFFRRGAFDAGMIRGVEAIGAHLIHHFPRQGEDVNELPDRPSLLR